MGSNIPSHQPERRNVMSRIRIPVREETPAASQPVLDKVEKMLGFVPNLQRLMSISPAALTGWAGLMGQLSTTLDVKTRDGIALAVSEADGCNYCLAAHSYIAHNLAKIDTDEIAINREGKSSDPKRQAAIMFAKRLIETAGKVSDEDFESVREAGWSDANIIEIIALSAQFLLTNFVNNAVQTPIDFPAVEGAKSKAAGRQCSRLKHPRRRPSRGGAAFFSPAPTTEFYHRRTKDHEARNHPRRAARHSAR